MAALLLLALLDVSVAIPWQQRFDLDGDGVRDAIEVGYTGGAHCCYQLAVRLASGRRYALPFQMDGGYPFGLDLSQPERFAVRDVDGDGRPDLLLLIETYSMDVLPIPKRWTRRYGIRTHWIAVGFRRGRLRAWDAPVSEHRK